MTKHVVSPTEIRASLVEQINTVSVTNLFEDKQALFTMKALQLDENELRTRYEGFPSGTFIAGSFSEDHVTTFVTFLVGVPSKVWWDKTYAEIESPVPREACKAIVILNADLKREGEIAIIVGDAPAEIAGPRTHYFAHPRPLVANHPYTKPANLAYLLQLLQILIGIFPSPITFQE